MTWQENIWDQNARAYLSSAKEDQTGVFAYEKYINTPSLLSLFPRDAEKVLDLGSGVGYFTHELTKRFDSVVAIDGSSKMLEIAQVNAPNAMFIKHDLETPLPGFDFKYDLITAKLLLLYIEDLELLASECSQILGKNGAMLVSVTHPTGWLMQPSVTRLLEKSLVSNTDNYFEQKHITRKIGGSDGVKFTFIHRTLQTYVNVFRRHRLVMDLVDEPRVSDAFLLEFPNYNKKRKRPLRLNFRLVKR